jgi:hypothetical protein
MGGGLQSAQGLSSKLLAEKDSRGDYSVWFQANRIFSPLASS